MAVATVNVGPVRVTYVHEEPSSRYALLEWESPAGAASPPVHIHHRTEEGFYVIDGRFRFLVGEETAEGGPGFHVVVRPGVAHTFWNPGDVPARCLIVLSPGDFAPYFRDLSQALFEAITDEDAIDARRRMSAMHDIEVVGPPIKP